MKLYFAPLEGIGTYIYRNAHNQFFGGCDAYYAPFIYPTESERISKKHLKDILPENNSGINIMVQILTNNVMATVNFCEKIKSLGYDEVNINMGCPYTMVVKKGRGAGLIKDKFVLKKFLDEIYSRLDIDVTLKTRAGYTSSEEMEDIIRICNNYSMPRLIIHPRTREEFYKGMPHMDAFDAAYKLSVNKLCYNGDVYSVEDFNRITAAYPNLDSVMIGRGILRNPALFREINGGKRLNTDELKDFTMFLGDIYFDILKSETFTLHKLKEIWVYMSQNYPQDKKAWKKMKKSNNLADFYAAMNLLPKNID